MHTLIETLEKEQRMFFQSHINYPVCKNLSKCKCSDSQEWNLICFLLLCIIVCIIVYQGILCTTRSFSAHRGYLNKLSHLLSAQTSRSILL